MGRYVDLNHILDRYPSMSRMGGSTEVGSAYIDYVERQVDGLLASHYTVPFSSNNVTVRDLCIDLVYAKAGNLKLDEASKIRDMVMERIDRLKSGEEVMLTTSGDLLSPTTSGGAWSTTENYKPIFDMSHPLDWETDPDRLDAEDDERDG